MSISSTSLTPRQAELAGQAQALIDGLQRLLSATAAEDLGVPQELLGMGAGLIEEGLNVIAMTLMGHGVMVASPAENEEA